MQSAARGEVGEFRALSFAHHVSEQRSIDRITLEVAQNPVTLRAPFELAAGGLGILGSGENCEEFIDGVDSWSLTRQGAEHLALQNQIGVAADRRA